MEIKEAIHMREPYVPHTSGLSMQETLAELNAHGFVMQQFSAFHMRVFYPDYKKFFLDVWPTSKKLTVMGVGKGKNYDDLLEEARKQLERYEVEYE